MSLEKGQTISSVFWKLFERCGSQVVSLVVQIVIARLLSPADYGALAVMVVFINIANVFVQTGFATALVQAEGVNEESISSVFWLTFVIALLIFVGIWIAAPMVAIFYYMPSIRDALRVLAITIPIGSLSSIFTAIISREMEFRKFFSATIISVVCSGSAGIALAAAGMGLWALVTQQVVFAVVNCVTLGLRVTWRPSMLFNIDEVKRLFSFGWKLLVSALMTTCYQSLSDILIGKQFSPSALGTVSQGKKIPMTLGNVLDGSIQPVMLSAVARVQQDSAYVKRLVRRALKTSTFIICPAMTIFAVAAKPIVALLFGDKWLSCVPFFQMYCLVYMLLPIHTTNLQALNGVGRSDIFLKLECIKEAYGLVNLLIMAFVFKDVYLMVGSYILTGIVSTFVNAWPNKRIIGYSYFEQIRDICPAFLLSALSGSLAWCVSLAGLPDILTLLAQIPVMIVSYLGFAKLFHVEELDYLVATAKELLVSRKN